MFRNLSLLLLSVLVAITLVFGTPLSSDARKEGIDPSVERLSGPAIVGTLTFVLVDGIVHAVFSGNCKGDGVDFTSNFSASILPVPFASMTSQTLEDMRMDINVPCSTETQSIINTVSSFSNNGTIIQADVVSLFVVLK